MANRKFYDTLWSHVGRVGTGKIRYPVQSTLAGTFMGERREVREWRYHWGRKESCRKCKVDNLYSFSEGIFVNVPSLRGLVLFAIPVTFIVWGIFNLLH